VTGYDSRRVFPFGDLRALEVVPCGDVALEQRVCLGLVGAVRPRAVGVVLDTRPGIGRPLECDRVVDSELETMGKAVIEGQLQSVRGDPAARHHHRDAAVAAHRAQQVGGQCRAAGKRTGNRRILVPRQESGAHIHGVDVDLLDDVVAVQTGVGDIQHHVFGQRILATAAPRPGAGEVAMQLINVQARSA
jgi:hypothetical protein